MSDRHQSQPALLEVVEMKNNIDTYNEGKMALLKKGVNSYEKEAELRKSLDVYFEDKIAVSTTKEQHDEFQKYMKENDDFFKRCAEEFEKMNKRSKTLLGPRGP